MKSERGQALILIALGMVALLALTALAIDGGMAYAERRSSQNAADNAALAAAYRILETGDQSLATAAAQTITNSNGFDEENSVFDIQFAPVPSNVCGGQGVDITVSLGTSTETSFGGIVGVDNVDSTVRAVTRACFPRNESLLSGDAVVGLDPDERSFESTSNAAEWEIKGGGLFANNEAYNQNSTVNFVDGHCATVVGNVTGNEKFPCYTANNTNQKIQYPADALAIVPAPPACTGTAVKNGNNYSEQSGHENEGSKVAFAKQGEMHFAPGIYCITGADKSSQVRIYGDDVLFWIMNPDSFEMKFAGGGSAGSGFYTTGRVSGPERFNGFMLIIPISEKAKTQPCSGYQNGKPSINFRGNGNAGISGTILAPSACIDFRGNSKASALRSQIIGYKISSNGGGYILVDYRAEDNRTEPKPPVLELLE